MARFPVVLKHGPAVLIVFKGKRLERHRKPTMHVAVGNKHSLFGDVLNFYTFFKKCWQLKPPIHLRKGFKVPDAFTAQFRSGNQASTRIDDNAPFYFELVGFYVALI